MPAARRGGAARISPEDLERALERGRPAPVYVLAGPEAVLRDAALAALKAHVIDGEFAPFNYRRVEPQGLDAAALVAEMRLLPMGGGGRLVVVSPAESLIKEQLQRLSEYASEPAASTCLVLVASELKETLRKAFDKAAVVDCGSPYEDKLPGHLEAQARRLGVRLERDAAAELAVLCGRELSRASSELEKAAEAAGPGGTVTRAMVEALAGGGESGGLFKISSALARGDAAAAVHAARSFLRESDRAEPRVLYELGLHLRKLLAAKGNVSRGMDPAAATRAAGVFWKDAGAFAAGLEDWSEARIAEGFRLVLAADRRVKTGFEDPAGALEACIWSIFGRRPPPGRVAEGRRR